MDNVINIKERLLKGMRYTEPFTFELPDKEMMTVTIRPIPEWKNAEVESMSLEGIDLSTIPEAEITKLSTGDGDLGQSMMLLAMQAKGSNMIAKLTQAGFKADHIICAYGIVSEDSQPIFTAEEIGEFPCGIPKLIADRIRVISGVGKEAQEQITNFRKD